LPGQTLPSCSRSGQAAPAVRGSAVRRMHGAGAGAPKGNRNALKHGPYTAETIAMAVQEFLRDSRELLE